jgi:hypothetical protein
MAKFGTTCPVNVVGSPGISMSHMCVDLICLPSGRLIVSGFIACRLFLTSAPSMIKIDVATVSAIASDVAIVMAFRYWVEGLPNILLAVAASDGVGRCDSARLVVAFDMTTVMSSDVTSLVHTALMFSMGSGKYASIKLLHLCAILLPAPHRQKLGNCDLCIPLCAGVVPCIDPLP